MKPVAIAPTPGPRHMRKPQHVGLIAETLDQRLIPWMAAPIRPGEVIREIDVVADAYFETAVQTSTAPLTYNEYGLWLVPLSCLGQAFVDLVVASGEDARDLNGVTSNVLAGSGVIFHPGGSASAGHLRPYLQNRNRPWAGEIGPTDSSQADSSYMPYTSFATWAVANTWYEIEWGATPDAFRADDDMFQEPPLINDYIQGALHSGISQAIGPDQLIAGGGITAMVERLSLLTKTSRTYAEYLAGFGINPRRVSSIPRPLAVSQKILRNRGEGTLVHGFDDTVVGQETQSIDRNLSTYSKNFTGAANGLGVVSDNKSVGMLTASFNDTFRPNVRVLEPSILLGTHTWWFIDGKESEYAHHLDMNRMVSGAHWGDPAYGGIDESEFLTAQNLWNQAGTSPISGEDGESGVRAMNMLNTYVNGDTFCNKPGHFDYRGPLGGPTLSNMTTLSSRYSARLSIETDMLGG